MIPKKADGSLSKRTRDQYGKGYLEHLGRLTDKKFSNQDLSWTSLPNFHT
jgi:hypothetical protein